MRRSRHWLGLLTCLLCWGSFSARSAADIYQRVDEQGIVHYTNVPPKERGWKRIVRSTKRGDSGRSRSHAHAERLPRAAKQAADPDRLERYAAFIREAAKLYQLPAAFIRAVMRVESNFFADVVSQKGAMGLMQLMPQTAASMGVSDPFDPRENILGGARYLRILANQYEGDMVLTLAAYNAGGGAVQRYNGVPPFRETQRYVKRVLSHYRTYSAAHD